MKPKPGDISIVENVGTFLMWYDMHQERALTTPHPGTMVGSVDDRKDWFK